jgi:hypothetical protein
MCRVAVVCHKAAQRNVSKLRAEGADFKPEHHCWLTSYIVVNGKPIQTNVHQKYIDCLNAPNYTLFSNTTSAQQWNQDHGTAIVPLESPDNSIHLAVGGYDVPTNDRSPAPCL